MAETLRIEHLSKTFPGQVALADVSLDVLHGEVHALVGQNGSGKSTLIKVLAGFHQPDPGARAWSNGNEFTLGDGQAAADAGVRFVHQDLGLVNALNTIENLALTAGFRTGPLRNILWKQETDRARDALNSLGMGDINVKAPVGSLPASQRTAVAIARALRGWENGASLLVLDEPTATLPGADVSRLFEVIQRLRASGVSILYVSHHLDEVFELADRVTVLRDAHLVASVPVASLDHDSLVELIIGRRLAHAIATVPDRLGNQVLTVRDLRGGNVHGLDLTVRSGEIVGLAGITGSGREHVLDLLAGQMPRTRGEIFVGDRELKNYMPPDAIDAGVAFVPADRPVKGAIATMSVRENLTIANLTRFLSKGRIKRSSEKSETSEWIERLAVRTASQNAAIGSLSGGNQQKVMFGKALRLAPKLLLLDEPTQGVDVGAKGQVHALVDEASATGVATLIASTDTEELVRLCHRVLVLIEGRVVAELVGEAITAETIEHTQLQSPRRSA